MMLNRSFFRVFDALFRDLEYCLGFRQARRIDHLCHPRLAFPLPQEHAVGAAMGAMSLT